MYFATEWFPRLQQVIRDRIVDPNKDDERRYQLALVSQALIELVICTLFFSIYLPLWNKMVCNYATRINNMYYPDRTKDEISKERMMLVTNFFLDLVRFVYGRGVLFKLSSPVVFFFLIMKDLCYQFWHFGFKYTEGMG